MELTQPHRSLLPETRTDTSETFHVLGHPEKAQVLLPTGSPKATARSLLRYHGGMGRGEQLARRGAAILARLGILALMVRGERFVDFGDIDDPGSLRSILSNATGEQDFTVAISFGPPRANQKPVIRIMRPDGSAIAFAKLGWNPLTARLVDAEVAALEEPGIGALKSVTAPRVLYSGPWRDNRVAVFTALKALPGKLTPSEAAFVEVAEIWPHTRQTLATSNYARNLEASARSARDVVGDLAVETVEGLLEAYGGEELYLAGWHGDWAPWNNARLDDNRIALWDWERAGQEAPEGFDSIHYRFQPEWLKDKVPTESLIASSTAGLSGRSPTMREAIGQLYVATIALRHLQPDSTGGPVDRSTQLLRDLDQRR